MRILKPFRYVMKYITFSKGWQNNACLPFHKQTAVCTYYLTVSSLSFAQKSSSERDYHLCKYVNGEAGSIEFCRRQYERNERPLTVSRLLRDFLAKERLLAV